MLKLSQQCTTMILKKCTLTKFNLHFYFFNEWIRIRAVQLIIECDSADNERHIA